MRKGDHLDSYRYARLREHSEHVKTEILTPDRSAYLTQSVSISIKDPTDVFTTKKPKKPKETEEVQQQQQQHS